MTEEARMVEAQPAEKKTTVTEEIKVQAEDLFKTINDLVREATVRRITIVRNERTLVDIPLPVGVAAGLVLGIYMPVMSALAGIGALLTGCTLRVERDEPPAAE